jgi:cytochrome c oxidase cbb3-type subunit 3
MSSFWSGWIILIAMGNILACLWLIWWTMKKRAGEAATGDVTGHTWDGNLQEYNNPLPRWWLWLFYGTIAFAFVYLALYPGLGSFQGIWGWSSGNRLDTGKAEGSQLAAENKKAAEQYGPLFAKYAKVSVADLGTKPEYQEAREMGKRLYLTYCMQCHGSTGRGARGFPNLTDSDWLWGGDPETIELTIMEGRGISDEETKKLGLPPSAYRMPAQSETLTAEQIVEVTEYVQSLSGRNVDRAMAEKGKATFDTICVACHGPDGKGLQPLGAPNLTDNTWLYGGNLAAIKESIAKGRHGYMPAQWKVLSQESDEAKAKAEVQPKVRLLAGYVYSLSQK